MSELLQKLLDILLYVPRKILELLLDALAALLEQIPVPDWLQNIPDGFAALGSTIWYFLDAAQISYGFSVITGAFVLRFIIRRLPFIG